MVVSLFYPIIIVIHSSFSNQRNLSLLLLAKMCYNSMYKTKTKRQTMDIEQKIHIFHQTNKQTNRKDEERNETQKENT